MTTIGSLISPTLKQTLMGAVAINESLSEPDEVRVTLINGVEYDVRGEAMAETTCADCSANLLVEVAPKGVDLDLLCSRPRVAVCEECGVKRVAGKRGTLIHHKPQEAPVPEIDLTTYSEAELAQLAISARARMVAEKEAEMPEKRTKAQKAEAKRIAKDQALKEQERMTAPVEALATVVEPEAKAKVDRKAKIAAYAEVTGMTKKQARKRLEAVGVI